MRRKNLGLCLILAVGPCAWTAWNVALAQDETIISATQLVAVINQPGLQYPLANVTEPPLSWQTLGIFWADFTQLTNAIGDVRNFEGETQYGISVWRLRLTRTADETVFSYPSANTNLLQLAATEDGFSSHYEKVLFGWCILAAARNYESYEDLLADGFTFLNPKRLVLDITLGDVNDCETYESNIAGGGMFMMMSEEDSGDDLTPGFGIDGDPCSITNLLQRFSITSIQRTNAATTITWESCPIFRYRVLVAEALSANTIWLSQTNTSYIWGQPGASTTSYTDFSTTNVTVVTQRFYQVEKLLGNTIAAGGSHSLAVLTNGTLWAWGQGTLHQLGDGAVNDEAAPVPLTASLCSPVRLTNAVALAGGSNYSVAVDAQGIVWSWGDGRIGELGNGGNTNVATPTPINGISNVVSVAAGTDHTLALRADGTVWAWGNNQNSGVLGNGQLGAGYLAGAASTNSPVRSLVPAGTFIVAIAAGDAFSLALDTTGSVWGWGANGYGMLGTNAPVGSSNAYTNLPTLVAGISNVIAIAAGQDHSVAITTDKRVWTWGYGQLGQLGRIGGEALGADPLPGLVIELTNQNVVAIAAGNQFTMAVTSNGQVYAWGNTQYGAAGTNAPGSPVIYRPFLVAGISNVVSVSAHPEGNHCLAVTVNQGTNQYYGWGANYDGQVGDGAGDDGPIGGGLGSEGWDNQFTPTLLHFCDACASCVPLGTGGVFTAQCTGTLKLYFNDTLGNFSDNDGGSYTAKVFGISATTTNLIVFAKNGQGVPVGTVIKGSNYTYTASGFCGWGNGSADPNGYGHDQLPVDCSGAEGELTCPNSRCVSLVGRIQ